MYSLKAINFMVNVKSIHTVNFNYKTNFDDLVVQSKVS